MPLHKPPLAGVRVLDFTRVIAGPLCTQQLADLGAEVIKIENVTTGDEVRGFDAEGKPDISPFFMAFNRSKKSVALDLKAPEGRAIALRLAGECDVLVENFRPGVMQRFGLHHERVRQKFPRLIYVSISAYGANVPMSDRPGFDPVLQAESGMMELTGEADGPPMRTGLSMIDTLTAAHASTSICAALLSRAGTGSGDYLDLALLDTAVGALGNLALSWLVTGELPSRAGNAHIEATPTALFATTTEPIYVAVPSDRLFRQFCADVLERPELPDNPKFAVAASRRRNRSELMDIVRGILATQSADHWLQRAAHLPAGRVRTLDKALESDEVLARDMLQSVTAADGSEMKLLGSAFKFTDTALQAAAPPPRHGQHTDEVLTRLLGIDPTSLQQLRAAGTIR